MNYEKIIKRPDGNAVKIIVSVHVSSYGADSGLKYSWFVVTREKGKKLWKNVSDTNDYSWRKLSMEDRVTHNQNLYLQHVTIEEVQETAVEFWQLLKPKLNA